MLRKLLDWDSAIFLVVGVRVSEHLKTIVRQLSYDLALLIVEERSAFFLFNSISHVDEEKRRVRVHEFLLLTALIATVDPVVVVKHVRHIHQRLVHPVLSVKEVEVVACFD